MSANNCLILGSQTGGARVAVTGRLRALVDAGKQVVSIAHGRCGYIEAVYLSHAPSGKLPKTIDFSEDLRQPDGTVYLTHAERSLRDTVVSSPGLTRDHEHLLSTVSYAEVGDTLRDLATMPDLATKIDDICNCVLSACPKSTGHAVIAALMSLQGYLGENWGWDAYDIVRNIDQGRGLHIDLGAPEDEDSFSLVARSCELLSWITDGIRGKEVALVLDGCPWSASLERLLNVAGMPDSDYADVSVLVTDATWGKTLWRHDDIMRRLGGFAARCAEMLVSPQGGAILLPATFELVGTMCPRIAETGINSIARICAAADELGAGKEDVLRFAAQGEVSVIHGGDFPPLAYRLLSPLPDLKSSEKAASVIAGLGGGPVVFGKKKPQDILDFPDETTESFFGEISKLHCLGYPKNGGWKNTGSIEKAQSPDTAPDKASPGWIVVHAVGNAAFRSGNEVASEFKDVAGVPLPLVPIPDLKHVSSMMRASAPHAVSVTDRILRDVGQRGHVGMKPYLLVGDPGSGKTTFACDILRHLGIPHEVFSCGGASDSAIGGSSRQWSGGGPSLPLSLVSRHRHASPGIVLDELDKIGTSRHNGNAADVIVGLTETKSSSRWMDPYLQAEADLSKVVWTATANDLECIARPLRDRFTIVRFPMPTSAHLNPLAQSLLRETYLSRGMSLQWVVPFDEVELEALKSAWKGGSLRVLSRLVVGLLDARDAFAAKTMN